MKKLITAVIVFVAVMCCFLSVCAEGDTYKLYNKDIEVTLTQQIVENEEELYIALEDLDLINLSYTEYDSYIEIYRSNAGKYICTDYRTVDKSTADYYVNESQIVYIRLSSIINSFSNGYNIDESIKELYLYINDGDTITLNGTLTIPNEFMMKQRLLKQKFITALQTMPAAATSVGSAAAVAETISALTERI